MTIRDRRFEVLVREIEELIEHAIVAVVRDRVAAGRRRRHRREADFPEPDVVGEVTVDALHVEVRGRQRHARANRAAAVPPQQLADFRRHQIVAAGAVVEHAELVLHVLRTVDRDRDADPVLGDELDDLRLEQRRVGREAEVDRLARFGRAPPRVLDRLDEHREVEQRLAAEERDVRDVARLAQQEVDALARRLLRHELRLAAVRRVDDLVLAVLVTIRAAEIALVGDVQHHRREWKRRERDDLGNGRPRHVDFADRLDARQIGDRLVDVLEAAQLLARARTIGERAKQRVGGLVELEDRGARHEIDERLPRRLEPMMLTRGPGGHLISSANQFMYSGTVTSRCARARSLDAACSATTHTSPMLLRLPGRFGFGPSTLGVNNPF